jgi:hypothetical protein
LTFNTAEQIKLLKKIYESAKDHSKEDSGLLQKIASFLEISDRIDELNENDFLKQSIESSLTSIIIDVNSYHRAILHDIYMWDYIHIPTTYIMPLTEEKVLLKERRQLKRSLKAIGETVAERVQKRQRTLNKFSLQ